MGYRLLAPAGDAAAVHLGLPPGGLRENAGEVGCVSPGEAAAGHTGHALVGQHDETGQIVLEMPKLALVLQQVSENPGAIGNHGSRFDHRPFQHTPPCPG